MSILFPQEFMFAKDVGYSLTKPCNDCPFRRDAPDHIGVAASIPEYLENIHAGRFSHTCHKTDCRPGCDGPRTFKGKVQHCAGALHFLLRTRGIPFQATIIQAANSGRLNLRAAVRRAVADKIVFRTVKALLKFYLDVAVRHVAAEKADPKVACVFPDNWDDPPKMRRLSEARRQRLEVLECKTCGNPANHFDNYWPYMTDCNYCPEHGGENHEATVEALKLEVKHA